MHNAVALLQALLRSQGYFAVTDLPMSGVRSHGLVDPTQSFGEFPMNTRIKCTTGAILFAGLAVIGCTSPRAANAHIIKPEGSHEIKCAACYDVVVKEFRGVSKVYKSRRKLYTFERRHMCPDCAVQVTMYTEDGIPFIKCAKCAPEGVPCANCVPPESAK